MKKEDIYNRVLKEGKPLNPDLYTWDEGTRTFYSKKGGLVLDFKGVNNVNFNTVGNCTFNTGGNCTFNTGGNCTFDTRSNCSFKTGSYCNFNALDHCSFKTGSYCNFVTYNNCNFNTGSNCFFTIILSGKCTFKVKENCSVIARHSTRWEIYRPIPNQEFTIDKDLRYDNPLVDIKYKKESNLI